MKSKEAHCSNPSLVMSSSSSTVLVSVIAFLIIQDRMNIRLGLITASSALLALCCSLQVSFSCFTEGKVNIIQYPIQILLSFADTISM